MTITEIALVVIAAAAVLFVVGLGIVVARVLGLLSDLQQATRRAERTLDSVDKLVQASTGVVRHADAAVQSVADLTGEVGRVGRRTVGLLDTVLDGVARPAGVAAAAWHAARTAGGFLWRRAGQRHTDQQTGGSAARNPRKESHHE